MSKSRTLLILNFGMLVGCLLGVFLAPPNTSPRFLVLACVIALITLNSIWFLTIKFRKIPKNPMPGSSFRSNVIWILLGVLLLVQLLVRLGYLRY
jgi:hypothetical protein